MADRYFVNNYRDYESNGNEFTDEVFIKELIKKYVQTVLQNTNPQKCKISSRSRPDLYVGFAGIAFMFLKLSQSVIKDEFPALEYAKIYADFAEEILRFSGLRKYISLLSGNAGVHIVSAAVNKSLGKPTENDVKNLLKGMKIFVDPEYLDDGQDEMLVGRCGYILGINWLKSQLKSDVIPSSDMYSLAQIILESGRNYAREYNCDIPLMYHYHGREYLGAAHGISAILFALLQIDLDEKDKKEVKDTIDKILELQNESGNFPSKYAESQAHLVHWCHGAPGVIYLMAKAYKVFGDEKYLNSCLKCGDLVWQRGLLKKGPGICHGIGSSGYVHLLLYQLTGDQKHLYRANKFALFLNDDGFLSEARQPDRPFSLFEGISGTVCFLMDLLDPQNMEFPFMNVF